MTGRRVVIVDDHGLIRDGLATQMPGHAIVGRYRDVAALLAEAPSAVDVVLLDLDLAGTDVPDPAREGAAAVRLVARAGYRVLIYTNERRRRVLIECVAAGARGIVHKAEPLDDLARAIETVAAGEYVITTALVGLAELYARRGELPGLTARQHEVLGAKARGTRNDVIAERLHLSVRTVEFHYNNICRTFADYLASHSPADLERHLGVGEGDVLDWRAAPPTRNHRSPVKDR